MPGNIARRGSIRKRGANSWEVKIELERVNGKRNRRFVTVRGTRKDAQRELTKLLNAADEGTLTDPSRMSVGDYLWARLETALNLSPKTLERYRELAERQIIPHMGDIKLQKLRPENIEQWHAALLAGGLSARTVGHAHRLLSRVLKRAVENGTLLRNVAAIHKPPKVEDREIEILTVEEIARARGAGGPRPASNCKCCGRHRNAARGIACIAVVRHRSR